MRIKLLCLIFSGILVCLSSEAQKRMQVSGVVTGSEGKPVSGIAVFTDDVNTGKITNSRGEYKIIVPPGTKTIRLLTPSGQIVEKAFAGQDEINFIVTSGSDILVTDADSLNSGAVAQEKKNKKSDKRSGQDNTSYKDIYDMIMRIPGIQVRGNKIEVTGMTTRMSPAGTDPLFIVNGLEVRSIDHLVPSNVKSIEVLKGTEASIYGVRGANGVIVITLK